MLTFKLTNRNLGLDVKTLNVVGFERSDDPTYELPDGVLNVVRKNSDKVEYKFKVKDIFNIQSDNQINVISNVTVGSVEDGSQTVFSKLDECNVVSVDDVEKTISINLDKEVEIGATNVSIETRYHVIYYSGNSWRIQRIDRGWIDTEYENFNNFIYVPTNGAPYGNNAFGDSTVFYYENDVWKSVSLVDDDLEGCLKNDKISLNSFHSYDKLERDPILMERGNLYYTHENYLVIDVSPTHYFPEPIEEYNNSEKQITSYDRLIVSNVDYPSIYFYVEYDNAKSLGANYMKIKKECHIEGVNTLILNYDLFRDNAIIETTVTNDLSLNDLLNFADETNTELRVGLTKEEMEIFEEKIFPYGYKIDIINKFGIDLNEGDEFYDVLPQNGVVGDVTVKRDNFIIEGSNSSYSLEYDATVNVIQIPISQNFETGLHHNDMLETNYVNKAKENAVNPIVDMEKDVYTPVICDDVYNDNEQINSPYTECFKIIFNLHFRKHRDITSINGTPQEWVCDKEAYWNGTTETKENTYKRLQLRPSISLSNDGEEEKGDENGYFSYFPVDEYASYQSDLLSFLGFSNNDIRYQKSKLKKSFLRISFYDSENVGNQNLLCASTIFLDSGDLFAKYIKNIETVDVDGDGTYMATVGTSFVEGDTKVSYNVNGVRVNREPIRNADETVDNIGLGDNVGDLEDLRLSSQFVVTDKYSSKHSSEGFYFYTYKTNDNGVFPSDIYMRVEFNHAGYGRTIPFMMPYVQENEIKENKYTDKHIKSFKEICEDWSEVNNDGTPKHENDIGYGSVKYLKYSHLKWKYRYDKDTEKHIYYLDPQIYGKSVVSGNGHGNNIILNLYEGKIR